jgi:Spy/CpxP family protein refolding chaperone
MVVNVVALFTIASRTGFFRGEGPRIEDRTRRGGDNFRERESRFSRGMRSKLDLSEEQELRMEELRRINHTKMEPVMSRMDTLRRELNEAMGSREIDEIKIRSLNDEMVNLDRQIRENLFEFNMEVRGLLDEEQLNKYLEMHKRTRNKDGFRRGRGERTNMIKSIY